MSAKTPLAATALVVFGIAAAAPAGAATAYLTGMFGVNPGFSTITGPDGQRCVVDCTRLRYDNLTDDSAARAIAKFVAEHGLEGNTVFAYSLATNGVLKHLAANPDDRNTYILLGSPSHPGSNNPAAVELPETRADVSFVARQGDGAAQYGQSGSRVSTHVYGYRYLDMTRDPVATETVDETVDAAVYDETAKLDWRERRELRRENRIERAEARRQARIERRAEAEARWKTFIGSVFGRDADSGSSSSSTTDNNSSSSSSSSSSRRTSGSGDE